MPLVTSPARFPAVDQYACCNNVEFRVLASVICSTHGLQQETMVCQHVVFGLIQRNRVGFFCTLADPDNPRPDAWCQDCEQRVRLTAGEWIGEALEMLEPKVLCGACYDTAKVFHMGGDPLS